MNLERFILDFTSERIGLRKLQSLIKEIGLPSGKSQNEIYNNNLESVEENFEKYERLFSHYKEIITFDNKAIRFYRTSNDEIDRIFEFFSNLVIPDSVFSESWPNTILVNPETPRMNSTFTFMELNGNNLHLYFSAIRVIKEEIPLNPENYSASEMFEEIFGIRYKKKQFIDVITINKSLNLIEIKVDNHIKISKNDLEFAFKDLERTFSVYINEINLSFLLGQTNRINFHPALKRIHDSLEGRICEARFITGTNSIKQETMRRLDRDLRSEIFHKGGMDALNNNVSFYWLGVRWGEGHFVKELIIPGQLKSVLLPTPINDEIIISGCYSAEDYLFIFEKLFSFIR